MQILNLNLENPGNPVEYIFQLPADKRPTEPDPKFQEEIFQPYYEQSKRISPLRPSSIPIRGIVIHATAGGNAHGAASVITAGVASYQFLIAAEDERDPNLREKILATTPESRIAQSIRDDKSHPEVLKGTRNLDTHSLSIEIVNRQDGLDPFSEGQLEQTARLIRHLWFKYEDLEIVYSHAAVDPLRRTDPGAHFPWARLENMIINGIPSDEPEIEEQYDDPFHDMLISQAEHEPLPPLPLSSHFKTTSAMPTITALEPDTHPAPQISTPMIS